MIQIKDLNKVYDNGSYAVKDFNLDIEDNEFVVFVGPSGCGKSTTLRMIAGLEDVSKGTISINDKVINDLQPKDRKIAMVFQNYALYPHMTVYKNLAFGLKMRGIKKKIYDEKIQHAAQILEIENLLDRKPKALSGGQRQRIGVARAIALNPKLIIADEPVSALDVSVQAQVLNFLQEIQEDMDLTMLFIAHDLGVVRHMCEWIGIMYHGRLVEEGPAEVIFKDPQHIYTKKLIAAIPDVNVDNIEANLRKRREVQEEFDNHFHEYLDEDGKPFPLVKISENHSVALPPTEGGKQ